VAAVSGPPVLVTGLPRSGTSWTGRMLAASGELVYVNEPLNPGHPPGRSPGVLDARVTHRFQYICAGDDAPWAAAFGDTIALRYRFAAELRANRSPYDLLRLARYGAAFTLGRALGRRALLDDPFALLSAAWFHDRLGCRVVVLVRDPVALAGSWRRLGWTVPFRELLDQPGLVRDHPCVARLRAAAGAASLAGPEADPVANVAALWTTTREIVATIAATRPGVRVARYEGLVRDPVAGFRDLYAHCGLTWSRRAARRVARSCSARASSSGPAFRRTGLSRTAYRPMDAAAALTSYLDRLTDEEIDRVVRMTCPVSPREGAVTEV
jgi:hypothetical protein